MLEKFFSFFLPLFPKEMVQRIAMRYIAGEDFSSAIQKSKELNREGFFTALDILGEDVEDEENIKKVPSDYKRLLEEIKINNIKGNISLKLTHLGLKKNIKMCKENFFSILQKAKDYGIFVRIDMEDSTITQNTLDIYLEGLESYGNVGVAIQSYMKRSENDLKILKNFSEIVNIRLCKGIYNEPPEIVYKGKRKIRENFIKLAKDFLNGKGYLAIATHDIYIIDEMVKFIEDNRISKERVEFQSLLGVPITKKLKSLLDRGFKVRIYVPFGSQWYSYSLRRLKENPDLPLYIIKNLFKRK